MRAAVLPGLQAIETAWRSAEADVGITIDSILIVREQSGTGFSSMGPMPRRPWSAFQARKGLKEHSPAIVRIIRKVNIVVEFSIIGKDAALLTLERYVFGLDISTTPSGNWGAGLLRRWNRSRSFQPRPDELHRLGHYFELRAFGPGLLVVPLIKL